MNTQFKIQWTNVIFANILCLVATLLSQNIKNGFFLLTGKLLKNRCYPVWTELVKIGANCLDKVKPIFSKLDEFWSPDFCVPQKKKQFFASTFHFHANENLRLDQKVFYGNSCWYVYPFKKYIKISKIYDMRIPFFS